jgi:two-component system NtrC family sensor kinase
VGVAGYVFTRKEPVVVKNAQQDLRFYKKIDELSGLTTRSLIAVPLLYQDSVIGVVEVVNPAEGLCDRLHLETLTSVANSAAIAIKNAELYRDLKNQMKKLHQAQERLVYNEKMAALGRLSASIAHEVNNPLQSMRTYVNLAKEGLKDTDSINRIERYLDIVDEEIERISHIVSQMRIFKRHTAVEMQLVDIHGVLNSVLTLADKQLQKSGVRVIREWASHLPPVRANADRLKQVFLNLTLNAADAMPAGGILNVTTSLDWNKLDEKPQPAVRIDLKDTGVGIPQHVRSHIFEPFFSTKQNGSGLGLPISYGIIKAHKGIILVESKEGKGSTFSVFLPVDINSPNDPLENGR